MGESPAPNDTTINRQAGNSGTMRLLVLNVDRDNDLGRKTGIPGPCIGRESVLEAATKLAVADPEEADANGMFAAVKEFDEISAEPGIYGADAVFVAAVTGHMREGTHADAVIAHQVDEILAATSADHVILVSDGGEDEHLLPILQTRMKVDGVRRVVVKQARNLEGALYLFSRLLHDEKLQKKFFLPFALLLVAAAIAFVFEQPNYFVGASLFLGAVYIFVQVFKWQEPIGNLMQRLGKELKAGKLSFAASVVALVIIFWAGFETLETISAYMAQGIVTNEYTYTIVFVDEIFSRFLLAVLVVILGRAFDERIRENHIRPQYWEAFFFALAFGLFVDAGVGMLREHAVDGLPWESLVTAGVTTQVLFGGFLFMLGLITQRYYRQLRARTVPVAAVASPGK